ncbi:KH homology domain-containing protein 4 isoform X3 [Octopus sinensis]|uniref:KH homology domain-containing protein 4 n=1 Tax=Octopus sinensis TaxID=2607531 RepID=A0A7E6FDP0_9MOLL|nr:KH homology domain-containing protein 4 isoform X3 [Octopus sinensis]
MAAIERSQIAQSKSSLEAAAEAAAKVNAMLIAKGKLKPSQLVQPVVNAKSKPVQEHTGINIGPVSHPGNLIVAAVVINDVPTHCRNMLTKGTAQEEISKLSGASVSTRGRYMSPEDKIKFAGQAKEKPLYLCVQGPTQETVDNAVSRINEIIANGLRPKGSRFSPIVRPPSNLPPGVRPPPINQPPPTMMSFQPQHHQSLTFVQEKLFIGLEHAPPTFDVKTKILGPAGCFLQHIQNETGAKVTLRGKGSNFIESTSGREAFEPMHIHLQHANIMGLQQAKQLAENLIQTVQQDYAQFQQALAAIPASMSPGTATLLAGLQQQTSANPNCGPGGMMAQQQSIPQLSVSQQPQYSQIPGPGMQTVTSLPPTFQQVLPTSSVVLSANSLPASLTSMPPPTLVSQASAQGPPPAAPAGQMDASGSLLPNASLPPPLLQVSTAPGMSQYATTTNDPFLGNANLGNPQPAQVIVGQQTVTPLGMSLSGGNPQMAPQYGSPVPNSIAPPMNALQPGVQFVSQQQLPPAGQPPPPYYGQFSGSAASLPMSLPAAATYTVAPTTYAITTTGYAYNVGPPKDDSVQPPPPPPHHAPPSQSPVPPQQPPKRRFTEEKPEDKIPENLLGYQHGPPQLANMIASGPPPPVVGSHHQSPVTQSFTQPLVAVTQTSQVYEEFRNQGFANPPPVNQPAFVTPPPPPPPSHSPSPERSEVDKHLMPPPPPPGSKRTAQHQGGTETQEQRKKIKGALGSVAVYGSDDEEDDSSSPSRQQQQQRTVPYSQSSSTNAAYVHQGQPSPPPPSLPANHYDQYLPGQVSTSSQQQQPLQHGQYSPPDPNNGTPYQPCSSPTNFASKQSTTQPQQNNHRNSYEQILSTQASQFGVPRPLSQSTFATSTTGLQTSPAYIPQQQPQQQQQQQQQQPQPPQFNGHTSAVAANQGYLQQFANQPPPSQQFSGQPSNQAPPFQPPPPPGMSYWMSPA